LIAFIILVQKRAICKSKGKLLVFGVVKGSLWRNYFKKEITAKSKRMLKTTRIVLAISAIKLDLFLIKNDEDKIHKNAIIKTVRIDSPKPRLLSIAFKI
jgi:hypothetical protein